MLVQSAYGGDSCPFLVENRACNASHACDGGCTFLPWGGFSDCSEKCGGGIKTKKREIFTRPANLTNIERCGLTSISEICNSNPCPVPCVMSDWTPWTECSVTCGRGVRRRVRSVQTPDSNGGRLCPTTLEQSEECGEPCPVHCKVSDFGDWSACSAATTCGNGTQTRQRFVMQAPRLSGHACPELLESRDCAVRPCAEHCELSPFTPWSMCSKSCGGGVRSRLRWSKKLSVDPKDCGPLEQKEPCNVQVS